MSNSWCFPQYLLLYFLERISLEGGEESDISPPVLSGGSAVLNSLSLRMPSRAPLISLALMYKEPDLLPFLSFPFSSPWEDRLFGALFALF